MNYVVKMQIEIIVNSDDGKEAREYASDVVKSFGIERVSVISAERCCDERKE